MKWYIGQPIVAIKDSKCGKIKKGQEFTILGLKKCDCKCGDHTIIDVGIKKTLTNPESGLQECTRCGFIGKLDYVQWKNETLFAPLDVDISELTKILKTSTPHEQI